MAHIKRFAKGGCNDRAIKNRNVCAASVGLIPSTSVMILSHSVLTAAGRKSSPKVIMPDTSATSLNASCVTSSPE